ncbi:uncharacterized protein LOC114203948 [Eumetopias jubatus]|uniref:uncharacterized protein LOC114203948 n=1 Tax=Eumetopias jubatus TaxID=34886 RepID=UPI001016D34B|nr:uncharacterized protein LOC114203948 [Eumetopias jubatus]
MWGRVHTDGSRPPQDPLWRTWGRVHADRGRASSGLAEGGGGEEKPPERGLRRGCELAGPRGGGARCVDAGALCAVVLCAGLSVSPSWARIRSGVPGSVFTRPSDAVPGPRSRAAVRQRPPAAALALPGPRPCGSSPRPHRRGRGGAPPAARTSAARLLGAARTWRFEEEPTLRETRPRSAAPPSPHSDPSRVSSPPAGCLRACYPRRGAVPRTRHRALRTCPVRSSRP